MAFKWFEDEMKYRFSLTMYAIRLRLRKHLKHDKALASHSADSIVLFCLGAIQAR